MNSSTVDEIIESGIREALASEPDLRSRVITDEPLRDFEEARELALQNELPEADKV